MLQVASVRTLIDETRRIFALFLIIFKRRFRQDSIIPLSMFQNDLYTIIYTQCVANSRLKSNRSGQTDIAHLEWIDTQGAGGLIDRVL